MELSRGGLILILILGLSHLLHAQDVHYSQRLALNNQRNPVLRANFDGSWQAATVYRSQWQSIGVPFESSSLWFTKKILTSDPSLDYFGGIAYQHDQSGDAQLAGDYFQMHFGARKSIDEHRIGFGIQTGFVQKIFNQNGLTFPNQYDRSVGLFNENLENGEGNLGNSLSYFDMGIGFSWEKRLKDNLNLLAAISSNHLLEPEESFFGNNNQRERTYESQIIAEIENQKGILFTPYFSYYYSQGASEGLIGTSMRLPLDYSGIIDDISPFAYFRTAPGRNTDAIIVGSTIGLKDFQFGLSYDFNISDLELASNYRGGFEITLVYTGAFPQPQKIRIPCVRY